MKKICNCVLVGVMFFSLVTSVFSDTASDMEKLERILDKLDSKDNDYKSIVQAEIEFAKAKAEMEAAKEKARLEAEKERLKVKGEMELQKVRTKEEQEK
ncbi:MAG: hypothetical protein LBS29_02580, partial [Endomicrobium sp.]|nr:hypothetical protein [Endomicrobium sp.]